MESDTDTRKLLLQRIRRLPADKLEELNIFISKLEKAEINKEEILSYAGIWENLDENILNELTIDLNSRRVKADRRNNE